jgi:hypothetical protein
VFSFGVCVFEMLTFSLPFSSIKEISAGKYKLIKRNDIPFSLKELMYKMISHVLLID